MMFFHQVHNFVEFLWVKFCLLFGLELLLKFSLARFILLLIYDSRKSN